MTAEWSTANGRAELLGDGAGWSRMKKAFPAPPYGTNSALYLVKLDSPSDPSPDDETPSWDANYYVLFSFDGNHVAYPTVGQANFEAAFANAFGFALLNYNTTANRCYMYNHAHQFSSPEYGWLSPESSGDNDGTGIEAFVPDGNGGTHRIIQANYTYPPGTVYVGSKTMMPFMSNLSGVTGAPFYRCFWARSSMLDDSVLLDSWLTTADAFAIGLSNIPNDDPRSVLPAYSTTLTQNAVLQGDVTATNWRPTSGVMGFPTHFLARWPLSTGGLRVYNVGVKYATLTV